MTIEVQQEISAPRERVWEVITNPDHWQEIISGILSVEVLERPTAGVVGLKWREKRMMFGKEATETMWISKAEPNHWYETTAKNHGAIYTTRLSLEDAADKVILKMQFSAEATTFGSKLMSMMSFLFNSTMRKLLQKDLQDIKAAAEKA